MNTEYLTDQLDIVYAGKAWYGKNILHSLQDLNIDKVLLRLGDGFNIAELVYHMLAWRKYTLFVLQNDAHYEMEDGENFPRVTHLTTEQWDKLLTDFAKNQAELKRCFRSAGKLTNRIPKKRYTLMDLLQGIIHHDIYHIGQINMLARL